MKLIERLLDFLFERHDIGRSGVDVYLTRWVLWGNRFGPGQKVFLHLFHRGDAEPYLHNHPWSFWSLILWGGYWEWTLTGYVNPQTGERQQESRWYGPLRLLRRPAAWFHRVTLPPGRRCWTLIWTSSKKQSWGFLCKQGWLPWRKHAENIAAGIEGCGEME